MARHPDGYRSGVAHDDDERRPTTDHPLGGEKRPQAFPLLMVLLLVVVVVGIFALITLLRYTT